MTGKRKAEINLSIVGRHWTSAHNNGSCGKFNLLINFELSAFLSIVLPGVIQLLRWGFFLRSELLFRGFKMAETYSENMKLILISDLFDFILMLLVDRQ